MPVDNTWLYSLPTRNNKSAGKALRILCEQMKPADYYGILVDYLLEIFNLADARTVNGWLSGDLDTLKRRFTLDHFRTFVIFAATHKNGLQSWDEVVAFTALFGDEYLLDLQRGWTRSLPFEVPLTPVLPQKSDQRYPREVRYIENPFLTQVIEKLQIEKPVCVIIWGQPGTGKTLLIEQLQRHPEVERLFGKHLLTAYLAGQKARPYLQSWLYQLDQALYASTHRTFDDAKLQKHIGQKLGDKRFLLLLDDVSDAKHAADLIGENMPPNTVVIITTNNRDVARELKRLYRGEIMDISPFGENEACQLYESLIGHPVADEDYQALSELLVILQGNPLGLHAAFHQLQELSFSEYLQLIKSKDPAVPAEFASAVYLPLQVAYERMDTAMQRRFLAIAALPYLSHYDLQTLAVAIDPEHNFHESLHKRIIKDLNYAIGVLIPLNRKHQEWRIHQQVWQFARFVAGKTASRTDWLEKALHRKLDEQAIPQKPKRPFREQLQLALKFKRPRKFKPKQKALVRIGKIFRYSDYVTEWDIISENTAILASQEYIRGYRLYKWELRQRSSLYFFVYGLGAILVLGLILRILSTLITSPVFTQIRESFHLISAAFLFLIVIFMACFVLYNAILEINWNLLFTAIAERINASED